MTAAVIDTVCVRCSLGCSWEFTGEREEAVESAVWHREQVHNVAKSKSEAALPLNGGYGFEIYAGSSNGRTSAFEAADPGSNPGPAVDEGEPDATETGAAALSVAADRNEREPSTRVAAEAPNSEASPSPKTMNREQLVDAIRAHAVEHGVPPAAQSTVGTRLYRRARKLGLVWADVVEAAGCERPVRGRRYSKPLEAAVGTIGAGPTPASSGAGVDEKVVTSPGEGPAHLSGGAPAEPDEQLLVHAGEAPELCREPDGFDDSRAPEPLSAPPPGGASTELTPVVHRDPIRTADIPYDADRLEDEAEFLRRRAAALLEIAGGIRKLAALSQPKEVDDAADTA